MKLTLEYWRDGKWFVGRLVEIPGVFSQGVSLSELKENVREAYELMLETEPVPDRIAQPKKIEIEL